MVLLIKFYEHSSQIKKNKKNIRLKGIHQQEFLILHVLPPSVSRAYVQITLDSRKRRNIESFHGKASFINTYSLDVAMETDTVGRELCGVR